MSMYVKFWTTAQNHYLVKPELGYPRFIKYFPIIVSFDTPTRDIRQISLLLLSEFERIKFFLHFCVLKTNLNKLRSNYNNSIKQIN